MSVPFINLASRSGPTLRAIPQFYCPFCDRQVYTSIIRIVSNTGEKCLVRCCLTCSEIVATVPAPRLVGIEPNPGPIRKNKKSRNNKNKSQSLSQSSSRSFHIPMIPANTIVKRKFRFANTSTGSSSYNYTASDILGVPGSICYVSNSSGRAVAQSFRIKEIEVWGAPQSNGGVESISLEWTAQSAASQNNSSLQIMDTSINLASPCYLRANPPKGSQASFWQNSSNAGNKLFNLNIGANAIVDLTLEYVQLDDNGDTFTITYNSGSAVLGNIYYGYLDNGSGSHLMAPIYLTANY